MNTSKSSNIRVIHLATSHAGGAGVAARRLNSELNSAGIDSTLYFLAQKTQNLSEREFLIYRSLFKKLVSFFSTRLANFYSDVSFFSLFSSTAISAKKVIKMCQDENTVIHIHNWYNLFSQRQLSALISSGVPVVLTLHDQRLITGGCHYSLTCFAFETGCHGCPVIPKFAHPIPHLNSKKIRNSINKTASNVVVISPSKYLIELARKSYSLEKSTIFHVPNPISRQTFTISRNKKMINSQGSIVVGNASMLPSDRIKGGDLIHEALDISMNLGSNLKMLYLRDFPAGKESEFWNAIDCLLVPSRNDNSPNVIHEAKFLGIPVIATATGGITELLNSDFDLKLDPKNLSAISILNAIHNFSTRHYDEKSILTMQNQFFDYLGNPAIRLREIYINLVRKS
jgi:glycosyltransferase involved in cell wall biosynthesis